MRTPYALLFIVAGAHAFMMPTSIRLAKKSPIYMGKKEYGTQKVPPISVKYNCYKVLGVPKTADSIEIRKAFANLAMTCHPDVSSEPDAAAKFLLITEAYNVLSDEQARTKHDLFLSSRGLDQMNERITKPMTRAQAILVVLAGLLAGGPVVVPLTLARFCVEPFSSAIPSLSKSCRPKPSE